MQSILHQAFVYISNSGSCTLTLPRIFMDMLNQLFSCLDEVWGQYSNPACFSSNTSGCNISIPFSNISSNIIKHQLKYANKCHLNNIKNNLKSLISKQSKINKKITNSIFRYFLTIFFANIEKYLKKHKIILENNSV